MRGEVQCVIDSVSELEALVRGGGQCVIDSVSELEA